jgi:hypothetical protein
MSKIFLVCVTITLMFNIMISFVFYNENRNCTKYAEDEIRKAGSVLIMSVEENMENYDSIKTGDRSGLTYDAGTLFTEFSAFMRSCRYIKDEDVKMKILIFQGMISYYNMYNEEIYSEPSAEGEGITDIENKIKRQLIKVFPAEGFHISEKLFEGLEDKMIILIYEKTNRNVGFTADINNVYGYSKLKIS